MERASEVRFARPQMTLIGWQEIPVKQQRAVLYSCSTCGCICIKYIRTGVKKRNTALIVLIPKYI